MLISETTISAVKASAKELAPVFLSQAKTPVNGEASYICPYCGHGKGGDGMAHVKGAPELLKCFGCNNNHDGHNPSEQAEDVIAVYRTVTGAEFNEAVEYLASKVNIPIEYEQDAQSIQSPYKAAKAQNLVSTHQNAKNAANGVTEPKPPISEAFYQRRRDALLRSEEAKAYLKQRGISLEAALAAGVGYDEHSDPAERGYQSKRLIFRCERGYRTRVLASEEGRVQKSFWKLPAKGYGTEFFNMGALYQQELPAFVAEGEFSALSFCTCGVPATAICSVGQVGELLKLVEKDGHKMPPLIVALDNDGKGLEAAGKLIEGLEQLNHPYTRFHYHRQGADPNDYLREAPEEFMREVVATIKKAERTKAYQNKPDAASLYILNQLDEDINNFKGAMSTGFEQLDKKTGGLYAGLYVVAAVSSLGKTTLVHQIADQLAAAGREVLYFSLEQSKAELITKSIARELAYNHPNNKLTSLEIRQGVKSAALTKATRAYCEQAAQHLSITQANFDFDVAQLQENVIRFIDANNTKPVVIVDYLQILQPAGESRYNTKENIDLVITQLKRMSRDLDLCVFVISSINRTNYLQPVDFAALKESGAIEYTADVVLGLQLKALKSFPQLFKLSANSRVAEKREFLNIEKGKDTRLLDLVCLKNRFGRTDWCVSYKYTPAHDLFVEADQDEEIEPNEEQQIILQSLKNYHGAEDEETPLKTDEKAKKSRKI